ncbi:hypothetical protein HNR46_000288 [Haloferula luteola]|uniref:Uncharacterized protein n=1 Tax=Haloferula luteola TaxID=595692 RepID=A0A840UV46_9BACT|nr:hypothetical protein [Haloferula luteola]MBB5350067.1 hypothetical protein [Haloferula luteola]
MKTRVWMIFGLVGSLAMGAGWGVRRLTLGNERSSWASVDGREEGEGTGLISEVGNPAEGENRARPSMRQLGVPRSSDDLESILRVDPGEEFERFALWIAGADAEEIASYWEAYRNRENRNNEVSDLIFIRWTAEDTDGAIAAAEGTSDEHYAWWAWACHDPDAALREALANHPDRINNVAWGIGEFHAKWLMEHFDKIPEENREMAIRGLVKWDDAADPESILDFLADQGRPADVRMFKSLVRKDPWAAFDWILSKSGNEMNYSGATIETFIHTVSLSHPDLLERMGEQMPAGRYRRAFDEVVFKQLMESDPDAALEKALATEAPKIAIERLCQTGEQWIQKDPEKAFEAAVKLFAQPFRAIERSNEVITGNHSGYSGGNGAVQNYLSLLVATDAGRTMDLAKDAAARATNATDQKSPFGQGSTVSLVARQWAEQDLYGFSEWVAGEEPSHARTQATVVLVEELREEGMQEERMEWILREPQLKTQIQWSFREWFSESPERAREWAESADLNPEEVKAIQSILNP